MSNVHRIDGRDPSTLQRIADDISAGKEVRWAFVAIEKEESGNHYFSFQWDGSGRTLPLLGAVHRLAHLMQIDADHEDARRVPEEEE